MPGSTTQELGGDGDHDPPSRKFSSKRNLRQQKSMKSSWKEETIMETTLEVDASTGVLQPSGPVTPPTSKLTPSTGGEEGEVATSKSLSERIEMLRGVAKLKGERRPRFLEVVNDLVLHQDESFGNVRSKRRESEVKISEWVREEVEEVEIQPQRQQEETSEDPTMTLLNERLSKLRQAVKDQSSSKKKKGPKLGDLVSDLLEDGKNRALLSVAEEAHHDGDVQEDERDAPLATENDKEPQLGGEVEGEDDGHPSDREASPLSGHEEDTEEEGGEMAPEEESPIPRAGAEDQDNAGDEAKDEGGGRDGDGEGEGEGAEVDQPSPKPALSKKKSVRLARRESFAVRDFEDDYQDIPQTSVLVEQLMIEVNKPKGENQFKIDLQGEPWEALATLRKQLTEAATAEAEDEDEDEDDEQGQHGGSWWMALLRLAVAYNIVAMKAFQGGDVSDQEQHGVGSTLRKAESLLLHKTTARQTSQDIVEARIRLKALTQNNLGCLYRKLGKNHMSRRCLEQALMAEEEVNRVGAETEVAGIHLNLTAVLSELGTHDLALWHAVKARELLESVSDGTKPKDVIALIVAYHNTAVEMEFVGQLEDSLRTYEYAWKTARTHLGEHPVTREMKKSFEGAKKTVANAQRARGQNASSRQGSSRESQRSQRSNQDQRQTTNKEDVDLLRLEDDCNGSDDDGDGDGDGDDIPPPMPILPPSVRHLKASPHGYHPKYVAKTPRVVDPNHTFHIPELELKRVYGHNGVPPPSGAAPPWRRGGARSAREHRSTGGKWSTSSGGYDSRSGSQSARDSNSRVSPDKRLSLVRTADGTRGRSDDTTLAIHGGPRDQNRLRSVSAPGKSRRRPTTGESTSNMTRRADTRQRTSRISLFRPHNPRMGGFGGDRGPSRGFELRSTASRATTKTTGSVRQDMPVMYSTAKEMEDTTLMAPSSYVTFPSRERPLFYITAAEAAELQPLSGGERDYGMDWNNPPFQSQEGSPHVPLPKLIMVPEPTTDQGIPPTLPSSTDRAWPRPSTRDRDTLRAPETSLPTYSGNPVPVWKRGGTCRPTRGDMLPGQAEEGEFDLLPDGRERELSDEDGSTSRSRSPAGATSFGVVSQEAQGDGQLQPEETALDKVGDEDGGQGQGYQSQSQSSQPESGENRLLEMPVIYSASRNGQSTSRARQGGDDEDDDYAATELELFPKASGLSHGLRPEEVAPEPPRTSRDAVLNHYLQVRDKESKEYLLYANNPAKKKRWGTMHEPDPLDRPSRQRRPGRHATRKAMNLQREARARRTATAPAGGSPKQKDTSPRPPQQPPGNSVSRPRRRPGTVRQQVVSRDWEASGERVSTLLSRVRTEDDHDSSVGGSPRTLGLEDVASSYELSVEELLMASKKVFWPKRPSKG